MLGGAIDADAAEATEGIGEDEATAVAVMCAVAVVDVVPNGVVDGVAGIEAFGRY